MNFEELKSMADHAYMDTYARFPLCAVSGKGSVLTDIEGKTYIDFASGIGVNSLGFCDNDWADAIADQAHKLNHISNLYYNYTNACLADKLIALTGMSKVFFSNSGAESNEGAIKLARKYSFEKYGPDRFKIITLNNSFHGRTITTLAATGQDVFHNYFFPFTEGFKFSPPNDIEALKQNIDDKTCAIMIEVIQGEGGVNPLDMDFVAKLFELAKEKDILVIADEVQTGIGRTGKLLASEYLPYMPDVITLAKGLAGGLPMGAVLCNEKLKDVLSKSTHATTFGGNPIASAGALVVLDKVSKLEFLDEVVKKGEYIKAKVLSFNSKYVAGFKGLGLMMGIKIKDISHKDLCSKLLSMGVLALTAGNDTLRLLPPLTITYEEIDKGLEILKSALCE